MPNKKVYILGKSFKPETNITTGSPSILLKNILKEKKIDPICFDPYIDKKKLKFKKGLYFLGTKHRVFENFKFPKGSVIIDPFRIIKKNFLNVKVIRLGDQDKN